MTDGTTDKLAFVSEIIRQIDSIKGLNAVAYHDGDRIIISLSREARKKLSEDARSKNQDAEEYEISLLHLISAQIAQAFPSGVSNFTVRLNIPLVLDETDRHDLRNLVRSMISGTAAGELEKAFTEHGVKRSELKERE